LPQPLRNRLIPNPKALDDAVRQIDLQLSRYSKCLYNTHLRQGIEADIRSIAELPSGVMPAMTLLMRLGEYICQHHMDCATATPVLSIACFVEMHVADTLLRDLIHGQWVAAYKQRELWNCEPTIKRMQQSYLRLRAICSAFVEKCFLPRATGLIRRCHRVTTSWMLARAVNEAKGRMLPDEVLGLVADGIFGGSCSQITAA